ncbi:MAG: hypothetical protein ACETVX_02080 [bacterium]
MKPEKLIFSSILFPTESSQSNALLLADSIRTFAGSLAQTPIWFFVPEYGKQLSPEIKEKLVAMKVKLIQYEIDNEVLRFPFTADIIATSLAESKASGQADLLAWLGTNTIFLQEPSEFVLPDDKNFGYRPVHHTLVGSLYDKPLDRFWTLIYQYCKVPDDQIFPMTTHVDGNRIRPYFNAGLLVTRPEKYLLRSWQETFFQIYQKPELLELYRQDERYAIFIHQAILSGVVLSTLPKNEIQELPSTYNYPLHLYSEDITNHRPSSLAELVTFRHEGFQDITKWMKNLPTPEPLTQWFTKRLKGK